MGISTGTYGVWQQHAVEPAVDDAVAGTQGHTTAIHDEVWQAVLRVNIDGLGVGRGVTERLHHQIR